MSPIQAGRPVSLRILRCIGLLCILGFRSLGVQYRRAIRRGRSAPLDQLRLQYASLSALLQECATDLRTALLRMECRFDALPEMWTCDGGPLSERDPSGSLQPNTDSYACMRDIETFQKERPTETLFDVELFHRGWVSGAKYGSGKTCREGTEGKSCNPPEGNRIQGRRV